MSVNPYIVPDFQGVQNFGDIQSRFVEAARSIMLSYELVYKTSRWRITALELYLKYRRDIWWDMKTDEDKQQRCRDRWYVLYKGVGPAYSRIDITAGNEELGVYAGLLIRELDLVDGSALALQKIVREKFSRTRWTDEEINVLEQIDGSSIYSGPLRLEPLRTPIKDNLWIGPRIFSTNPPKEPMYRDCCLRVATWPTKKHVTRMKQIPPGCW